MQFKIHFRLVQSKLKISYLQKCETQIYCFRLKFLQKIWLNNSNFNLDVLEKSLDFSLVF